MKIRELYSDPSKWTKRAYARDPEGEPDFPRSQYAVCWCLDGAIELCYPSGAVRDPIYEKVGCILAPHWANDRIRQTMEIQRWNDAKERTFEDVKRLVEGLDI